jgi:hypothetical protein
MLASGLQWAGDVCGGDFGQQLEPVSVQEKLAPMLAFGPQQG